MNVGLVFTAIINIILRRRGVIMGKKRTEINVTFSTAAVASAELCAKILKSVKQ